MREVKEVSCKDFKTIREVFDRCKLFVPTKYFCCDSVVGLSGNYEGLAESCCDSYDEVKRVGLDEGLYADKDIISILAKRENGVHDLGVILSMNGILAADMWFRAGISASIGTLKAFGKSYDMKHAVLLLGDGVLDFDHSEDIVPLKDYIAMLEKENTAPVTLDNSGLFWYDAEGKRISLKTIDDLKKFLG